MAKLNLKKATPIASSPAKDETPQASQKPENIPPSEEEQKLEVDATAEPGQTASPDETVAEEFEMEEIESGPEKETGKPKDFQFREDIFDEGGEGFDFNSGGGLSKTLIIVVIIIFLLIGSGFLLYKFTGIFDSSTLSSKPEPEAQKPLTEQATPTESEPVPPPPTPSSPMVSVWLKNMGHNQFMSSNLEKIVNQKSSFSRFSLIVINVNEVNLTALSDSPDKLARFKDDLNKALPQLNFRTISTQEKYINESRLIFSDLNSKVPASLIRAASGSPTKGSPSTNLKSDLTTLTKKHKLTLKYFNAGKISPGKQYKEMYYYINIQGSRTGTLDFLKELTSTFPAVKINKISVNPTNLITYSNNSLFVRLNLSFMN
jgi:hypothetical protein